jgi:hypothetical protein
VAYDASSPSAQTIDADFRVMNLVRMALANAVLGFVCVIRA